MLLPSAPELEQAVLGCLINFPNAVALASGILTEADFSERPNQIIWKAIENIYKSDRVVDTMTLVSELRAMGKMEQAGGAYYLTGLDGKTSTLSNLEYHCRILQQKRMQRFFLHLSDQLKTSALTDSDPLEMLASVYAQISDLEQGLNGSNICTLTDAVNQALKDLRNQIENPVKNSDIKFGLTALDDIIGGLLPGDLCFIAARPGHGKTDLAIQLLKNNSVFGNNPGGFFSLEMQNKQIAHRMLASVTGFTSSELRLGHVRQDKLEGLYEDSKKILSDRLFIDDTATQNTFQLRAKVAKLKQQNGLKYAVVDYVQLLDGIGREDEVTKLNNISKAMKQMAKQYEIPVVLLAQLNREVDKRSDKKPIMSDLKGTSQFEQDADQIIFIYRAEKYGIMEDEDGNPTEGKAELIAEKNRHGEPAIAEVGYTPKFSTFYNLKDNFKNVVSDFETAKASF